ncbi:MAG TPA: PilZ domain-containing protein [Spirochaetota bacterium]|nr:PilZ domain-containing protein [Spirochaetota bacterium]HRZ28547.1 PilZ domain-containing protein [Spirochaetota bacterium]HSA16022.1 PilZ domain-containing protein [Spirochaetota bacterium]
MDDKRKFDRIRKSFKCEVHSEGMTFSSTIDVSNGGLFISTPEPLNEGDEITLVLYVDDNEPVEARARVRWVRDEETDDEKSGMGVEFLDNRGVEFDLLKKVGC